MGDGVVVWGDGTPLKPQETAVSAAVVSRRHLLHHGLMGGASALLAQQVTQRVVKGQAHEQWTTAEAVLRQEAASDLEAIQTSLPTRIDRLEQELALCWPLEQSGLDALIATVLEVWNGVRDAVRGAAQILHGEVESVDIVL